MATTPRGIEYPTTGSGLTPLATAFATLASSVDDAIDDLATSVAGGANAYTGTNTARLALTGADLHEGITWYTTDTNLMWFYNGSAWKMIASRPILVSVIKSVAQNTSTSSTAVTWNTTGAAIDTDSMYSTGSNTRITFPYSGVWKVTATLKSSGVTGITGLARLNGSTNLEDLNAAGVGTSGAGTTVVITGYHSFASGDYIEIMHTAAASGVAFNAAACRVAAEFIGQV